jgi:hypothetical protein
MRSPTPARPPVAERPHAAEPPGPLGTLAAAWGLLGVTLLLSQAIWRLTPVALEALGRHRLSTGQWLLTLVWVALMGFYEGYRGFQRGFSPRVVGRALHLARHPRPLHVALAPLYCMGLIHASRRRRIASWSMLAGIFVLVMAVRQVAQPYRGIIDAGVVVGLGWGLAAMVAFLVRALGGRPPPASLDLPPGV